MWMNVGVLSLTIARILFIGNFIEHMHYTSKYNILRTLTFSPHFLLILVVPTWIKSTVEVIKATIIYTSFFEFSVFVFYKHVGHEVQA
jgi:hypothetical protein